MDRNPTFLIDHIETLSEEVFQPLPPNRRGEFVAWTCTVVLGLANGFLTLREGPIPPLAIILLVFFTLAAMLTSFGNWIEVNTSIHLSPNGVSYQSPLRKVILRFGDIEELWVSQVGQGWRIAVRGDGKYFNYRTAVKLGGRTGEEVYVGIENGERLASLMRFLAKLQPPVREGEIWICKRA